MSGDVDRYYDAALRLLAFVEQRRATGRRTGADAEARWNAVRGALAADARIDLLIRDADAEWPAAFGARTVFAIDGLAEDEPFGPAWTSLDPVDAETRWRAHRDGRAPSVVKDAVVALAAAWDVRLDLAPPTVAATERLVVVGPSAIGSAILAFADGGGALDWTRQVTVFASSPSHRQLAAAAPALLNLPRPTALFATAAARSHRGARLLLSDDAHPDDLAQARAAVG